MGSVSVSLYTHMVADYYPLMVEGHTVVCRDYADECLSQSGWSNRIILEFVKLSTYNQGK